MSPVLNGTRLDHLRALRDRVDAEIQAIEKGQEVLQARVNEQRRAAERAQATAQRDQKRRQVAAFEAAESARIEAAAPANLVRLWARQQGISIGTHGRLSLDLRKRYLADRDDCPEVAV